MAQSQIEKQYMDYTDLLSAPEYRHQQPLLGFISFRFFILLQHSPGLQGEPVYVSMKKSVAYREEGQGVISMETGRVSEVADLKEG